MQNYFANQKELFDVVGKGQEYVVLNRASRTSALFSMNNIFKGLLQENSLIATGDTLIGADGSNYFVVAKRIAYRAAVAELYKTNCRVGIYRTGKQFINGTLAGYAEEAMCEDIMVVQQTINANMKMLDPGLLPNTVKRFVIPKNYMIAAMDRVKLDGVEYQIDSIDTSSYEGFYYTQCSLRSVK